MSVPGKRVHVLCIVQSVLSDLLGRLLWDLSDNEVPRPRRSGLVYRPRDHSGLVGLCSMPF